VMVAAFGAFAVLCSRSRFVAAVWLRAWVGVCRGRERARTSGRRVGWRPRRWRETRVRVRCWPDRAGRSAPQGRRGQPRRYAASRTRHRRRQHATSKQRRPPGREWSGRRSHRRQRPPADGRPRPAADRRRAAWQCREHQWPHERWRPSRRQRSRQRQPLSQRQPRRS